MKTSPQKVDIIVITGDIANEGSIDEYRGFHENFLKKLLSATGLGVTNVIMCPGNHDIVLEQLNIAGRRIDRKQFEKLDKSEWNPYKQVFDGYIEYQREFGFSELQHDEKGQLVSKSLDLSFLKRLCGYRQIEGIDFISMNSAWFCRTHDWDSAESNDFEKLTIGAPFLKDAIGILELKRKQSDAENSNENNGKYSIMLSHHPFFFDSYTAADSKHKKFKEPDLVENPKENDHYQHKIRIYISCRYQWLHPEEIFTNCGLNDDIYGLHKSIIFDIENNINLILCGHLHEKVNPLLVGNNGTVGLIGGAICTAAGSNLNVEEPFCRFITINKKTKAAIINEFKYNRDTKIWSLDSAKGIGKTNMILHPAKVIQELLKINLDIEHDHIEEKLTKTREQAKVSVKGQPLEGDKEVGNV